MALCIAIGAGAVLLYALAALWNDLVRRRNQVRNALASIEAMLQKRHDLIPNLVAACRAYMTHERAVLERVTELRKEALAPDLPADRRLAVESGLTRELRSVFAAVENYPELKADRNLLELQAALNEVEEQISAARRFYNSAVTEYNVAIQSFPASLVAPSLGLLPISPFEATEADRATPDVGGLLAR